MKPELLKILPIGVFIICFFGILPAHAGNMFDVQQDTVLNVSTKEYELSTVTVTATRAERSIYLVPRAINYINLSSLRSANRALSLDESLRQIPGIFVNNRNNLSQGDRIMIRGIGSRAQFGVRGIKVLLDGIPLTMADGQSQLNNVDLSTVGAIEVIRGPSSSLYGNAAGGVINIRTENIQENALTIQPAVTFGSFGYNKWQGKLSGRNGPFDFFINVNRVDLDGYRENSESVLNNFSTIGHYQVSDNTRITTIFNLFDSPYMLNPSSLDKSTAQSNPESARGFVKRQGAGKKVQQGQGGLALNHVLPSGHSFDLSLYGLWRKMDNPIPGRYIDLDRTGLGSRFTFNNNSAENPYNISWKAGIDYEFQRDKRNEFENEGVSSNSLISEVPKDEILDRVIKGAQLISQKEQVFGIGPFAEIEYAINPKWSATVGGRYDYYQFKVKDYFNITSADNSGKRFMDQFSPMAAIMYKPGALTNIYANFSTAFQTPTTTELGNRQSGEGGFNPSLQPEKIYSFEMGFKGISPEQNLIYDFAVYYTNIKDMLIPFQIQDPGSEEVFFRNAGEARNFGIEARLQWDRFDWVRASLAYSHMDFVFKNFEVERSGGLLQLENNKVPGVPPNNLFADVMFAHPSGLFTTIELKWVDKYHTNDFNGDPGGNEDISLFFNDSYTTVDLRLGYNVKLSDVDTKFFLGIDNFFDKRYNGSITPNAFGNRFFEPAPGRNIYAGITFPLAIN